MSAPAATVAFPTSAKVVGLVSTAHFMSHFYLLLLPPLFPILVEVYGVGFTELGLAFSAMSLIGGLAQAPVGFVVDRVGARGLLIAAVALEGTAFALIGVFPFYGAMIALLVVAGLANSVYHPADYAILTASVNPRRMGRAFSIHTTAGFLGDAMAPVLIVFLLTFTGWRTALVTCGLAGAAVAIALLLNSNVLRDALDESTAAAHGGGTTVGKLVGPTRTGMALLFTAPILMGLLFYVGISTYGRGVNSFGPSVLHAAYDAPLAIASTLIACYLFASPVGVLVGGHIADRIQRHDAFAAICFVTVGSTICLIAATHLPFLMIGALFALAGFFSGMVAPSRDMLIRSLTPPGQVGKVFGFVSSGFSVGGVLAPPLFGMLLDNADPRSVFWLAGIMAFATTATVLLTGNQARRTRAASTDTIA